MPIEDLPIFPFFNVQRFTQFGSMDCANWYGIQEESCKKGQALYPAMGRQHINIFNENKLVFQQQPSNCFKSFDFAYYIVGTNVIAVDAYFNEYNIGSVALGAEVWADYLTVQTTTYVMLADGRDVYIIIEPTAPSTTFQYIRVTDNNTPANPTFVKTFGNRFIVSEGLTPLYFLTDINLANALAAGPLNPAIVFSPLSGNTVPLFNTASNIIRQMAVLHNQLYMFYDFTTDIYANIPTQATIAGQSVDFPFKQNSSYNFDFGISDAHSLDTNFGMMAWFAKNSAGINQFMISTGQKPENISTQAVNVLVQNSRLETEQRLSAFLDPFGEVDGFLYQYDNTIFYRVSAGKFQNYNILDYKGTNDCIEFNFSTKKWTRCIELNGEKNRIRKHIYFNNRHLVTVENDPAVYEMAGNLYFNETRNLNQADPQAHDAFNKYPMRYELVTEQIFQPDYSEFKTEYIEIDFVFGFSFYEFDTAFANAVFIITEDAAPNGDPVFVITEDSAPNGDPVFCITEDGNFPSFADSFYNTMFKPAIGLFYSDDGGITYLPADIRKFSRVGEYTWRMRWYQLDVSRNRTYKLICVGSRPIVILGGVQNVERTSGGAN